ncbi:hypothetical protein LK533_06005 [Sphingomonas sp. PL-96]|uniref:hypothetical protein n=1 Tax=Sphingomonas sp. PL-96 TaxID=2887201 RepID=UPI001E5288FE|nr:hypothetical protein [Sphingomonas sp. PL-96]MCC2976226.1 hypothetical protein [Sphingomonas sp. PL-96]
MTKQRPPLSFEQAIARIAGLLGWEEAAGLIGKKGKTLRDYGDPDVATGICLADAFTLDCAYRAAGGEGLPILQTYMFRSEVEAATPGHDPEALARLASIAAKEAGDAIAHLIAATRPGASPADLALAKRETEQAMTALSHTLPMLDAPGGASVARVQPQGGASK